MSARTERFLADVQARGVHNPVPVWMRPLWAMGIDIPPPPYWHAVTSFLVFGLMFGIPFALFLDAFHLVTRDAGKIGAMAGMWFGAGMALYMSRWRKRNPLPPW